MWLTKNYVSYLYIMKKGTSALPPQRERDGLMVGLSRKHIFEAVEASLKRLGTEYIDVLQIHRYDYDTPREETMKALHGPSLPLSLGNSTDLDQIW